MAALMDLLARLDAPLLALWCGFLLAFAATVVGFVVTLAAMVKALVGRWARAHVGVRLMVGP